MGMAITMTAAGLTVVLGIAWFAPGRADAGAARRGAPGPLVRRRRRGGGRRCRWSAGRWRSACFGHNVMVYAALLLVAAVVVAAVPHPLRPAPARGGREPGDGRCRGRLGAGAALPGAGAQRRARARWPARYLVLAQNPSFIPQHDRRPRLHGAGGDDLRQVAAGGRAVRPACCSGFSTRSSIRLQGAPLPWHRRGAGAGDPGPALRADGGAAGRLHRPCVRTDGPRAYRTSKER